VKVIWFGPLTVLGYGTHWLLRSFQYPDAALGSCTCICTRGTGEHDTAVLSQRCRGKRELIVTTDERPTAGVEGPTPAHRPAHPASVILGLDHPTGESARRVEPDPDL
jgi:hypothetical protein